MEGLWMKRYNELVEYKRESGPGHCRVPSILYKPNPQLGVPILYNPN